MKDGVGYDAGTCSDRVDTIEDLIAKDDRVWAVWTMRGTHTGQLFGIPATGQPIEILEAGIWRLVDGLRRWATYHELGKELLAGFATAELDKHLEKG
jgi:hypothetical protein